ncbi:unnamed protein product [Tuber melanosporum]|uniref:(Perigord truffle) hypothetical protein n=1 Tax=Tuber melanosporum (strain Mel28) TaxID=656061 RepID=D5G9J0_TUBMM|nr:uncharacterized protein GSTUM_00003346001 [Tuber melanosporum]CAZ81183.1 unnamed protein product [Tuber melanosporum]
MHCFKSRKKCTTPLNILLSNGRFPVSIDLARQLKLAGHNVYVVDPMHYHVCKFSNSVVKSYWVPAPHVDAEGYTEGVRRAVVDAKIDLIIPMHEELFHLAEQTSDVRDRNNQIVRKRLFAPDFRTLVRLHNKWEFSRFLRKAGCDGPRAWLCRDMDGVRALPHGEMELALKPVYGRAAKNLYHLKPDTPLPDGLDVSPESEYIAQEWISGNRYCSYSILRDGRIFAFSVYPVVDTIDDSSCVYFQSIEHAGIRAYVERIAEMLTGVDGQIAFDFIETGDRLVAIECNPRATSGIHLWSGTPDLAYSFTRSSPAVAKPGARRQIIPGMLMWSKKGAGLGEYLRHMRRLMETKDVIFNKRDLLPSLMQPFLLTSYYEICRERKMNISTMFQWDLVWEPGKEQLENVRRLLAREGRGEVGGEGTKKDVEREESASWWSGSGVRVERKV